MEQLNRLTRRLILIGGSKHWKCSLPDGPSADRRAWAAAAGEHGREVYRDDDNDVDALLQRLTRPQH